MKSLITYSFLLISLIAHWGCQRNVNALEGEFGNYPGGTISPYFSILDLRSLYKGADVKLNKETLLGSEKIAALVVSDHSGNNLPAGLLVVQDARRLSQLRGISLQIGADASSYLPGDSVIINIDGGTLTRQDGILQIAGIAKDKITKVSSGNPIPLNRVRASDILANPDKYESVFSVIVKGGFVPLPSGADILKGDKTLNDGFGNITLHTESNASFANNGLYGLANYYGITFNKQINADSLAPVFRVRKEEDIVLLSSTVTVMPVIIAGFMSDLKGGDGNYEYVQLLATKDINFSSTPYSVVVTNNANTSTPTGFPTNGWAAGDKRTYKFNLTSGFAPKGTFFYVGGTGKMINGSSSTSMSDLNWVRSFDYVNINGDGFGTKTSGLFANSGNASGVAVFSGTTINANTVPVDVIFVGNSGSIFTAGPPAKGYRITNTDWYDTRNPITLEDQPFFNMGSNTISLKYTTPSDAGFYNILGGVYNTTLGRWTTARSQINLILDKTSPVDTIQGSLATKLVQ